MVARWLPMCDWQLYLKPRLIYCILSDGCNGIGLAFKLAHPGTGGFSGRGG